MEGEGWKTGAAKYSDFEGSGYIAPEKAGETSPLIGRFKVDSGMKCKVSVRALKGGAHQDRALAVEVADKRLKTTHQGHGPAAGEFIWEEAGTVTLSSGIVEIKLRPVGKRHPCVDAIMLTPDTDNSLN